ncbi:MAG: hypothetical protein WCF84_11085 [Anaerolineae bacterium]
MAQSTDKIEVYLEIGKQRTFAAALDWPGWCRSGRDEASALQALLDYEPRYARVLRGARLGFHAPANATVAIVERIAGNASTDFGVPGLALSGDAQPVDAAELARLQKLLKACWRAFDAAREAAAGAELRKGPRGGGRDVNGIARHVFEAEAAYLGQIGIKFKPDRAADLGEEQERARQAILDGIAASARGELPARGPRGGLRWTPRYATRRIAWHVLDHAWEIEDRAP